MSLTENKYKIVQSIRHFKGLTAHQLLDQVEWLHNYTESGVYAFLMLAEKDDLIRIKENKFGENIYFATKKGIKIAKQKFEQ